MVLPANFRDRVLEALRQRGVRNECELCGDNNWSLVEQPVSVLVAPRSGEFHVPPPQIPSAGLICNHCGNMRLLALGALGLLNETEKTPAREPVHT
jgi:hypothetical protein